MIPQNKIQQSTLELYPTYEKFFQVLKPANLKLMYDDIVDVSDSVSELRLTLYDLQTIYTDGQSFNPGINYIKSWLEYLNGFSGINKPLTATEDVAIFLYTDFKHFYLTDLKVIFDFMMKKEGEYGKFYAAVDAQIIVSDFYRYSRTREAVLKSEQDKIIKKKDYEINKLLGSTRTAVCEEFKQNFPEIYETMGKQIYAETENRCEKRIQEIRKKYNEKYGI